MSSLPERERRDSLNERRAVSVACNPASRVTRSGICPCEKGRIHYVNENEKGSAHRHEMPAVDDQDLSYPAHEHGRALAARRVRAPQPLDTCAEQRHG